MSVKQGLVGFIMGSAFAVSFAVGVLAQAPAPMSDEQYMMTMKQIGPTFMAVNKANASMQHAQAAKDAAQLAGWFRQVQTYWEAKKVEDAIAFSKTAVSSADALAAASTKADMAGIGEAQKTLQGACGGCHMAHRERNPDGTFRIK